MINVRPINVGDLQEVASIHKKCFTDHYLGQFSRKLIAKFYAEYQNADTIFLVATENDKAVGFVLGGDSAVLGACANNFEKNHIVQNMLEVAIRPKTWKTSFEKFLSLIKRENRTEQNIVKRSSVSLLSIAVAPDHHRKGIAQALVLEFESRLNSIEKYHLSVKKSNNGAIEFYNKLGFSINNNTSPNAESLHLTKYLQ